MKKLDDNLNERVARFIAQYRTVIARSSVEKIEGFIDYLERRDRFFWAEEIEGLKEIRSNSEVAKDVDNEEDRYQELLAQDVAKQLLAIQGVKSVEAVTSDQGIESLEVTIQAYYLFDGIFYDAGEWVWKVPMCNNTRNKISLRNALFQIGSCFCPDRPLFYGTLLRPFKDSDDVPPLYYSFNYGFCFGDLLCDILERLKAGDFVSAFQLISLCLNHCNATEKHRIPIFFDVAYDADIRKLAESQYFDLNEEDIEWIEARHQKLREGDVENV